MKIAKKPMKIVKKPKADKGKTASGDQVVSKGGIVEPFDGRAKRDPSRPSVVSTFAGGGGSSQGYHEAGFQELLAVEWDSHAVDTLRENFRDVPIFRGDIAELSVEQVLEETGLEVGELDVLDGSPPCQGFSTAGKRAFGDNRNTLFLEFVRLLKGLQPKAFVMENVTGMVRGKMRVIFRDILETLEEAGYCVRVRILNASSFGVPQYRERVVFIGARNDLGIVPSHPEPTHGTCLTVRKALAGVRECTGEDAGLPLVGMSLDCWVRAKKGQVFWDIHPDGFFFNLSRCNPDRPSKTIIKTVGVAGFGGGITHWREPRTLSIAEIKRLSGFPDEYIFTGKFKDRWARVGNCVPPPLIRAIAKHLRKTVLSGSGYNRDG